jgi:hypothetical protein
MQGKNITKPDRVFLDDISGRISAPALQAKYVPKSSAKIR